MLVQDGPIDENVNIECIFVSCYFLRKTFFRAITAINDRLNEFNLAPLPTDRMSPLFHSRDIGRPKLLPA